MSKRRASAWTHEAIQSITRCPSQLAGARFEERGCVCTPGGAGRQRASDRKETTVSDLLEPGEDEEQQQKEREGEQSGGFGALTEAEEEAKRQAEEQAEEG